MPPVINVESFSDSNATLAYAIGRSLAVNRGCDSEIFKVVVEKIDYVFRLFAVDLPQSLAEICVV